MSSGWATRFPVYQIDFNVSAAGKRVAATKRKIRWRFGFPNKKALDEGLTGTDCRGEEHDVTIIWSITSGKRQIAMDGKEIHYSSSRAGILDFSWTTRGNHVIKVACHAAAPLSATPGFRQYDLFIDGQSFFTMPKVFELGIKRPIPAHARVPGYGYSSNPTSPISMESGIQARSMGTVESLGVPSTREQEEEDLKRAIEASLEESRRHLSAKSGGGANSQIETANLLDFGEPTPPTRPLADARSVSSMPSYYSAPPTLGQDPMQTSPPAASYQSPSIHQAYPVASPPANLGALVPSHGPPGTYYQAPQTTPSFVQAPQTTPSFAQAPQTTPSFAQAPQTNPSYAPQATPSYAHAPQASFSYASPPAIPPAPAPTPNDIRYASGPAYGSEMMNVQYQSNYVFGLNSPPDDDPFAPKPPPPPTRNDIASAILGAYSSPSSSAAPITPISGQNGFTPSPNQVSLSSTSPGAPMSMHSLTDTTEEEVQVNELDKALKNLVNIDHIDEPAEGEVKLTILKKEEGRKGPKGKSKPLPPVAKDFVGQNATLSQIKEVKHGQRTLKDATDGIMNAPPPGAFTQGAAAAGALVVHGEGPPPLHQPMGFGVGARLPNGGFVQQQQPSPMAYQQQYR